MKQQYTTNMLASRVCQSETAGFLWALAYLVNPFLLSAAAWDFHPITLAVPFVAISMLSIESKNFRLLFLCCLIILSCEEHLGVMVIGFGLLWWIHNKQWKTACGLILLGIAHFFLVVGFIMPALSCTGKHFMLTRGLGHLSRYSWLGGSLKEIFETALFHPISVIKTIMLEMGGAKYLLVLLIFFLGFPLAAPEFLLPGLADLMANLMSADAMPRGYVAYHNVCLVPVLTVAAFYGVKYFPLEQEIFSKRISGIGGHSEFCWRLFFFSFSLAGCTEFLGTSPFS